MRISISSLAWDRHQDESVCALMNKYSLDAVDLVPAKYFPDIFDVDMRDVVHIRNWWRERGVEPIGMQAILHGTSGLNLFARGQSQTQLLTHLDRVCEIGSQLGTTRIVFGSPRSRDRSGLSDEEAIDIALQFFSKLGVVAESHGVVICLEPNPRIYGCNFLVDSRETELFVRQLNHPAIRMQLDTGSVTQNGESITEVLQDTADLIGHVHVSEPGLNPVGSLVTDHSRIGAIISEHLGTHFATIEMLKSPGNDDLRAIESAIQLTKQHYDYQSSGTF